MDDDTNSEKMANTSKELFAQAVSPDLLSKIRGDFSTDPLEHSANRCDNMANGLLTMLESALVLNANSIDTQIPELREQFTLNVTHLREMIREGNATAAQQKLDDVIKTFISYRRVTQGLFGRLTNIMAEFPKYSSELSSVSSEIMTVRADILEDRIVLIGGDQLQELAYALYTLLVDAKESTSAVEGQNQSTEEIMDEKRTVAGKIGGEKREE